MANTTTEIITVNGNSMKTYAKNIASLAATLRSPGKVGANPRAAMRSGSLYIPNKPQDVGTMIWDMWLKGSDDDGNIPGGSTARREFFKRVDELTLLFNSPTGLLDIRHTLPDATIRQCLAETIGIIDFTTLAVDPLALFKVELEVPACYWQDVADTNSGKVTTVGSAWTFATGGTAPLDDAYYAIEGPITNPRITDEVSGAYVQYNGALTAGQTLAYTASTFGVAGNGGLVPNLANLVLSNTNGRLMRLMPNGSLQYRVTLSGTGTGAGVGLTVVGKRKYLVG